MEIEKEWIEVEKERWAYERERSRMEFKNERIRIEIAKKRIICFNFVYWFLIKFNKKFNSITLKVIGLLFDFFLINYEKTNTVQYNNKLEL
jgi:hypothetical protein